MCSFENVLHHLHWGETCGESSSAKPMPNIEIILILLLAVAVLAIVARPLGVPYPILLVLRGALLGFVPGLPQIELAPDLVFLIFLPPLASSDGWLPSSPVFRTELATIGLSY